MYYMLSQCVLYIMIVILNTMFKKYTHYSIVINKQVFSVRSKQLKNFCCCSSKYEGRVKASVADT